jgi:hypothetical protein
MKPRAAHRAPALRWALPIVLAVMAGPQPSGAQGVHVGITPASLTVSPDAEFDLDLTVTQAGSLFNGFDATVTFDPAALTIMPLAPPSLQQGCLMTGACSAACGNTFHRFSTAADSAAITDVLLCDQIALSGPGQIYKLRFKASTTPQVTHVRFRRATFYNAGLYVNPVVTADAEVTIGVGVGVGWIAPSAEGIRLRAEPNPGRGPMVFALEVDAAGEQHLEVHDVSGRLVRTVDRGWREQGTRRVTWDGTDESGVRAPSGVYLVTLGAGNRAARLRVALLR